jgi:hypothetical protein
VRDEKWFEDVEKSIMVAHRKIDLLVDQIAEISLMLDLLIEPEESSVDSEDPNLGH